MSVCVLPHSAVSGDTDWILGGGGCQQEFPSSILTAENFLIHWRWLSVLSLLGRFCRMCQRSARLGHIYGSGLGRDSVLFCNYSVSQWGLRTLGPLSVHLALRQGQALQLVREIIPSSAH